MTGIPAVSLLIATRNRAASLHALLARLERLSPALDWELVVADNGSSDATPQVLAEAGRAARLRAVHEPVAGKSRALNRALRVARGELIVFTDDDIEPHPDWLDELAMAARRHPDVDCFGGRIRVAESAVPAWVRKSRNLQEILTSEHDCGDIEGPYPPNRFPIGPNMAVRRRALEGIADPWPIDTGPGSALPVGDEMAFWLRIGQGAGRRRIYVPSALVFHTPDAGNLTLCGSLRRAYRGGYSGALVQRRYGTVRERAAGLKSVWARAAGTRSLRELLCVGARAAGVAMGRSA